MKTLREVRESKGVTKAAMCRHLAISKPTYDDYERNPASMRIETATKVAEFLGIGLQDIFFISKEEATMYEECETQRDADWEVVWTEDGHRWDSKMFASLDPARAFARELVDGNAGNRRFILYARRFVLVDTRDFLDEGVRAASQVGIASSFPEWRGQYRGGE